MGDAKPIIDTINAFGEEHAHSLLSHENIHKKIDLNYHKNLDHDHTKTIDDLAGQFKYQDCKDEYWNPEAFSLLYGTALWEEASDSQRLVLNHLFWVAYFSQIISAEIATILFNQTSAAGLYGLEDFRLVCDMLDLESSQERAHINAFKTISEAVELDLFGERLFSYRMRPAFTETMIFNHSNRLQDFWKSVQLKTFSMLSADSAFLACQYFTVRGLRTFNGRLVQRYLSHTFKRHENPEMAPIPSKISYYHFMDETYHFYSSKLISHDILECLPEPSRFERMVANMGIRGCQKDHYHFCTAVNGIFWYDPATYDLIYRLLRSPIFRLDHLEAKQMMAKCFTEESDGVHASFQTHRAAVNAYREFVADLDHISASNKKMDIMNKNSIRRHIATNRRALEKFFANRQAFSATS